MYPELRRCCFFYYVIRRNVVEQKSNLWKGLKLRPESFWSQLLNADPYKPYLQRDDHNHMFQMEKKQKPLNGLYVIDWINRGSVVCANWYWTMTPTGGGKVGVKLSSPESRSHNTPLRHGRLVWNIPQSSQPPSSWYEWVHWPLKWDAFAPIFAPHSHGPILTQAYTHHECLRATGTLCVTK